LFNNLQGFAAVPHRKLRLDAGWGQAIFGAG